MRWRGKRRPRQIAVAVAGLAALAGGGVALTGGDGRDAPPSRGRTPVVTVAPAVGGPRTVFVARARAVEPLWPRWENYHFVLVGPGGRRCDRPMRSELGYETPEHGHYVARYRPARADPLDAEAPAATWCPGTYRGRVELRNPGPPAKRRVLGAFRFTVKSDQARGGGDAP